MSGNDVKVPDYSQNEDNNSGKYSRSSAAGLNETLNTNHLDIAPNDTSICATVTRFIAKCVGLCFTPHQILVVLRVLKAVTFCFLLLTIAADFMYILFVNLASNEVGDELGGWRDTVLRVYALILAIMGICVELDVWSCVKHFSLLKGFIPRSFALYFISAITHTMPYAWRKGVVVTDDAMYTDDAIYIKISNQIPESAVMFQMVTSMILAGCAITYLIMGLLCCDRFTSRAFLSTTDPVISTAIPQPSATNSRTPSGSQLPETGEPETPYERV